MADGLVMKRDKTVSLDKDTTWEIRDHEARVEFVDFITENRVNNGVIYLSLGSVNVDANNAPVVDVSTRLRMDLATAQIISRHLADLVKTAQKAPEKATKN